MKFKDAFEHYKNGTATNDEAAFVEEELEKTQLIASLMDEDWDSDSQCDVTPDYQIVRKKIRSQRIALILLPVLIIALMASAVPLGSILYYDPTTVSDVQASASDFDLYLTAYTELFHPGYVYNDTLVNRTGIGRYQLELIRWGKNTSYVEYHSAELNKGTLDLPRDFMNSSISVNIIARASYPVYDMTSEHKSQIRQRLEQLPDYVEITAAISFPEDISMGDLLDFKEQLNGHTIWAGIRNAPEDEQLYPLAGLAMHSSGLIYDQINETYPAFETADLEWTQEMLEQHFESLLQYMIDHPEIAELFGDSYKNYYERVLQHIQQAGVKSYGCVVSTTSGELLRLLDEGVVTQVWPMDAEIKV